MSKALKIFGVAWKHKMLRDVTLDDVRADTIEIFNNYSSSSNGLFGLMDY